MAGAALSGERLAVIRAMIDERKAVRPDLWWIERRTMARDVSALIEQYERAMAVVQAVAHMPNTDEAHMALCAMKAHPSGLMVHAAPCVIGQARALLASTAQEA